MLEKKLCILVVFIFVCLMLTGCQEEAPAIISAADKVTLESSVVEFVNVSFEKVKNREGVYIEAELMWLFHNIAGRQIDVGIDILFFDENDVLIHEETKEIMDMPADYIEHYSPFNSIVLTGKLARTVDYVVIQAFEK